jgi:hypothetical protein
MKIYLAPSLYLPQFDPPHPFSDKPPIQNHRKILNPQGILNTSILHNKIRNIIAKKNY